MIPLTRPHAAPRALRYIAEAHAAGDLAGQGRFSQRCAAWLREHTGAHTCLLTTSCTAALEMAAILADVQPGDEVIMPSFTFPATANAFVLRGAVPVFVDIRADTLNIDETQVEAAITPRTKAIVVVHYAGVAAEMDTFVNVARRRRIVLIEDAAQALLSSYKGRALGTVGDIGCLSFHSTKNVISGHGGALLLRDATLAARAERIAENGTDRAAYNRHEVRRYTWHDVGSTFLMTEPTAAFLWAHIEDAVAVTAKRVAAWETYYGAFERLEKLGLAQRPSRHPDTPHNGHIFYLLLPSCAEQAAFIDKLGRNGVTAAFHFVPLHSSPAGVRFGRTFGDLAVTTRQAERLARLPLWGDMGADQQAVIEAVVRALDTSARIRARPR